MNTFKVLGITLTDHTVREAMRLVEGFLSDDVISTICYITAGGLLEAENRPETKAFLENMSLTIPADTEVLKAAGLQSRLRSSQITGNDFLKQFLHRITSAGKTVVLLSDNAEHLEKMKQALVRLQGNLRIVGAFALEDAADADDLINDMNSLEPNILISDLEYPLRESFFTEHHMKLHAQVWLLLKQDMVLDPAGPGLFARIRASFTRKALLRSVDQYNREEPAGKNAAGEGPTEEDKELLKMATRKIDVEEVEKVIK